jgi:hypothetical protein
MARKLTLSAEIQQRRNPVHSRPGRQKLRRINMVSEHYSSTMNASKIVEEI